MEYITKEMLELISHFLIFGFGVVLGRYALPYNPKSRKLIDEMFLPKGRDE